MEHTNRLLKLIGPLAGIAKRLRTHIGRHTCATLLLDKGYSLDTVAEVLGISLRVVTTYAKVTRVKVKREFERLGGL